MSTKPLVTLGRGEWEEGNRKREERNGKRRVGQGEWEEVSGKKRVGRREWEEGSGRREWEEGRGNWGVEWEEGREEWGEIGRRQNLIFSSFYFVKAQNYR